MPCPHCRSTATTKRNPRTTLGYPRFNCRACGRRCNERTGTPFNDLQPPTDIVLLAVLWRLRYTRSFRDVAELLRQRGYAVTHETVRDWEFRFAPLLANRLRAKRRGRTGVSWYIDETDVKVAGRWCDLYRAIDREGALIDSMRSAHRDTARRAALPAGSPPSRRTEAPPDYDRCASRVSQGDPVDRGAEGAASLQSILEQLDRAGSPGHHAALLPNARVWEFRVGCPVLRGLRCSAPVLSRSPTSHRMGADRGAAPDLHRALAVPAPGAADGVGPHPAPLNRHVPSVPLP